MPESSKYRAMELLWPASGSPPPDEIRQQLDRKAQQLVQEPKRKLKTLLMCNTDEGGLRAIAVLLESDKTDKQRESWWNKNFAIPGGTWQNPDELGHTASLSDFRARYERMENNYEEVPRTCVPIQQDLSAEADDAVQKLTDTHCVDDIHMIDLDEFIRILTMGSLRDFRDGAALAELDGCSANLPRDLAEALVKVKEGLDTLIRGEQRVVQALSQPPAFRSLHTDVKPGETVYRSLGARPEAQRQDTRRAMWADKLRRVQEEVRKKMPELTTELLPEPDVREAKRVRSLSASPPPSEGTSYRSLQGDPLAGEAWDSMDIK